MEEKNTHSGDRWKMFGGMMLLCCLLPMLLIIVASVIGVGRGWIFGLVAVVIVLHVWMMIRKHSKVQNGSLGGGQSDRSKFSCH